MKRLLPLLVCCTCYSLSAQITRSPLSSLYTGIGTYSRHFTDAFSGATNQAALAAVEQPVAGVYGERRFLLAALSNYTAALALPVKSGGMGLALHYFGAGSFTNTQLGFGYGRRLSENAAIGAQINYNTMRVPGYGSAGTVNFELGTLWNIREKLHLGFHLYNPVGGRFGKEGAEKLASIYTAGAGYEASEHFLLSTVLVKEEDQPVVMQAGLQYVFAKQFLARAGMSSAGGSYVAGVGIKSKWWRVDAVTAWHVQLGFTPAILLLFDLKEKKEEARP